MISKRGTKKLREAGIESLEIHKGAYGFSLYDPAFRKQEALVYSTPQEAVKAAIGGKRPKAL